MRNTRDTCSGEGVSEGEVRCQGAIHTIHANIGGGKLCSTGKVASDTIQVHIQEQLFRGARNERDLDASENFFFAARLNGFFRPPRGKRFSAFQVTASM